MVDLSQPETNSDMTSLEMAESSFLCASSDGVLWKLAKCTLEGEWTTGNIWQKTVTMPETQTPGTDLFIDSDVCNRPTNIPLKTWQRRKVSLRGHKYRGRISGSDSSNAFSAEEGPLRTHHMLPLSLSDSLGLCHGPPRAS